MYQDTITLFNRSVDETGSAVWFPHVLTGVNLLYDKAVISSKYGEQSKDNAVLNIRYKRENGDIVIGNIPYLLPMEWEKQAEVQHEFITFKAGNEFDFFMLGDYGSQETVIDTDDTFFREIQKEYDNVFAITSVAVYTTIPHFEILGK